MRNDLREEEEVPVTQERLTVKKIVGYVSFAIILKKSSWFG